MCQNIQWVISVGSIFGLIQSLVWIGFGITGALTYLCVLPVDPYRAEDDFFRVTLIKLYFEGPQCILDGSYLGEFNEEYKKLDLFTPDLVFSLMVAYVILNAIYLILSIKLYLNRKNKNRRCVTLSWSGMTLILCALDAFIAFELFMDFFTLRDHMGKGGNDALEVYINSARSSLREIPYISLILALISLRFVVFWLWNFVIGFALFLDVLCCRKIFKRPHEEKFKEENKNEIEAKEKEDTPSSISLINGRFTSAFDITSNPDFLDYKKSMEAVTRFSSNFDNPTSNTIKNREYSPIEAYWPPEKFHSSKRWEMTNEAFENDEPTSVDPDKQFDFDHDLKNFESGQRKIKIVKPPIGKPVSIPVPPPLPTSGSCRAREKMKRLKNVFTLRSELNDQTSLFI